MSRSFKQFLRVLAAFVLLVMAVLHPPMTPARAAAPQPAGVVALPDGTFADLCLSDHAAPASGDHRMAADDCPFCRLASGVPLPEPPPAAVPVLPALALALLPPVETVAAPARPDAVHGPRAPPILA